MQLSFLLKHLESDETLISDPRYIVGCWLLEERSGWWREVGAADYE